VNYAATENLKVYEVLPTKKGGIDEAIMACSTCIDQIENPGNEDLNHWRCLNDSMWSEHTGTSCIMENVESFAFCGLPRINRSNVFR
jgi:protein PhnA